MSAAVLRRTILTYHHHHRCLFKIPIRRRRVSVSYSHIIIFIINIGNGDRRRRARSLVYDQRGDRGRRRKRQRPGNVEKGIPVQDPGDATCARAAGAGEQHDIGHSGDRRNRRAARQEAMDVVRAQ